MNKAKDDRMMIIYAKARSRRGAASALIILLLVMLVFFGVLALVTAAADLRLAEKRAQWARDFYMADALAESVYAQVSYRFDNEVNEDMDENQKIIVMGNILQQTDYVARKEIQISETGISIKLLAAAVSDSGQGIDMKLLYMENKLRIVEWVQWQAPLQAPPDREDIWQGE